MAVCLVTGGNYHYSGLCDFSAITHYTDISAYAGLMVNVQVLAMFMITKICSTLLTIVTDLLEIPQCESVAKSFLLVRPHYLGWDLLITINHLAQSCVLPKAIKCKNMIRSFM